MTPVALAAALAACQYDPYTAIYTTKEPKPADVAGEYVLDEFSEGLVADAGYEKRATSIRLDADGTFTFTDLPDWWDAFGTPVHGFDSGRGTWTVERKQGKWWQVRAHIRETTPTSTFRCPAGGYGSEWVLADEEPRFRLVLTLGDPDEGRAMIFGRKSVGGR